jgi:hypothetical protein
MAALALLLPAGHGARAQVHPSLNEQKIQSGLIYNFIKATHWPANRLEKQTTLNICLIGGDPFDGYLHPLQGRTAQKLTIDIRVVKFSPNTADCHFAFIHNNLESRLPEILAFFKNRPTLTASAIPGFAQQGGMIEFSQKEHRVHLLMNREAAHRAGLSIENQIARLAEEVRP